MADPSPVLVLTRPERQSREFLADCKARLGANLRAIVSPVMHIEAVPFGIEFDHYRTLIVTSANALVYVGTELAGRRVVTVGEGTAARASEFGADAFCLGETVEAFLRNAENLEGPAIHLRGVHSRGNLAKKLTEQGTVTDECMVYDQVAKPMSEPAIAALALGSAIVPIFSPRTAALVSRHSIHPDTQVLAISPAALEAWNGPGRAIVADRPDKAAMLDLVSQAF